MESELSADGAADLLFTLYRKGVKVYIDNGRLRYQAPKGTVTLDELTRLRALKEEILALLVQAPSILTDAPLVPRPASDRVPLTVIQQVTLDWFGFSRRARALDTFPMRLVGELNIKSLRETFVELVRRHESLRTRIVCIDGIPEQEVDEAVGFDLENIPLSGISKGDREIEARRFIAQRFRERVDVAVGPLFAARLLKLDDQDHVLVISWDHLFWDAVSLGILWRDIWTMYTQSVRGLPFSLPKMPIQLGDFAVWEQKTSKSWMDKHDAYWSERLAGAQLVRLFVDEEMAKASGQKIQQLSIAFEKSLIAEVCEWSRQEQTTPMMSLLTAYIALVLRWCNKTDLVIYVPVVGRCHPEVKNTIGSLACGMLLRIQIVEDDSFLDLSRRVAKEYGTAYEHVDVLRSQISEPELLRSTTFNWFPSGYNLDPVAYFENSVAGEFDQAIRLQPFTSESAPPDDDFEWDKPEGELFLGISETKEGVTAYMNYRADRVTRSTVERFAEHFRSFIKILVRNPKAQVMTMSCQL